MLLFDAAGGDAGDLRVVCGTIMASISGSFGLVDKVRQPIAGDLSDLVIVRDAFAVMLEEIAAPEMGTRAVMKVCLVALFRRTLLRDGSAAIILNHFQDPRLGRAVAAVLDKPAGHHSVATLGAVAGMSRSVFARDFTAAFAMPMAATRAHSAIRSPSPSSMRRGRYAAHARNSRSTRSRTVIDADAPRQ